MYTNGIPKQLEGVCQVTEWSDVLKQYIDIHDIQVTPYNYKYLTFDRAPSILLNNGEIVRCSTESKGLIKDNENLI